MKSETVINFFPALNGDSFLVSSNATNILIDGGYVNTYRNFLKTELQEIARRKEKLDLVVITHIDRDHISGVNKLLEENNDNRFIEIDNIWHNSYRHLQIKPEDSKKFEAPSLKKVSELNIMAIIKEDIPDTPKNVSAKKGSTLAKLVHDGKYNWNKQFRNAAVSFQNEPVEIGSFKIQLLSPNQQKLEKLKGYWLKALYKLGYVNDDSAAGFIDDAFEFVVSGEKETKVLDKKNISAGSVDLNALSVTDFIEDNAAANGSSISFILTSDNARILFLGDSHPSVISESLMLLYPIEEFPLFFDAIKISHHGSALNTNNELLSLVDSQKYLISTNGNSSDHPDIETIARVVARKTDFKRTLYFNYPVQIIKNINIDPLKEKYNYECVVSHGTAISINFNEKNN
ncbi:AVAST type 1 anti-phage system MBL fold metallo-hydrolase Avs1a [Flavobacterium macacae]|uniref:MBL fold metallo-hydrolase n=1 Tax=Flavobacterium macacae TaxID=2488993 RepID=A0A3P3W6L1_9FLAO|nr:AVAST type 1 anti-phage system MBL fold metallo-hydrolase Avs1a [Flavobacterium macacae]RRJ90831.1 MBL fold metallo-hydrolase [Flavobacterium macacae]